MSVFRTQGYYELTVETFIDISSASTHQIKYEKPNGDTGAWTATIVDGTKLVYQMSNSDLDVVGTWSIQPYVVLGSLNGFGEIGKLQVKQIL